jgi:hypothetical protein
MQGGVVSRLPWDDIEDPKSIKMSLGYGLFSATAGGENFLQRKDNDSNIALESPPTSRLPQNVNEW